MLKFTRFETPDERDVIALMVRRANSGALANAAGALVIALISFFAPFWKALLLAIVVRFLAVAITGLNGRLLGRDVQAGRPIAPGINRMCAGLVFGGASWGFILLAIPIDAFRTPEAVSLMGLVMVGVTLVAMTAAPVPRAMWSFLGGFALVAGTYCFGNYAALGSIPLALAALVAIIAGYGHRIARDVAYTARLNVENKKLAETLGHLNEELGGALDRADKLARYDQLTGVRNRRAFEEEAGAIAVRRDANEQWFALLVDLDHFKSINDQHGHFIGDEVLRRVGAIIVDVENRVPHTVSARLGGEEFALLLPGSGQSEILAAAEAIRQQIERLQIDGGASPIHTSASFGLSAWHINEPIHSALRRADVALYEAKESGRNRIVSADRDDVGKAIRAA